MSGGEFFRESGKKFELPKNAGEWKLERRPGGWVIAESHDGRRVRLSLVEARGVLSASIGGRLHRGEIVQPARGGAGAQSSAGGDADLVAQFPGKVRKLLVAQGEQVEEGQPLLLVEAMKMEFAIKAPFAGTVEKLLVKEGEQLSPGARFLDLKARE